MGNGEAGVSRWPKRQKLRKSGRKCQCCKHLEDAYITRCHVCTLSHGVEKGLLSTWTKPKTTLSTGHPVPAYSSLGDSNLRAEFSSLFEYNDDWWKYNVARGETAIVLFLLVVELGLWERRAHSLGTGVHWMETLLKTQWFIHHMGLYWASTAEPMRTPTKASESTPNLSYPLYLKFHSEEINKI